MKKLHSTNLRSNLTSNYAKLITTGLAVAALSSLASTQLQAQSTVFSDDFSDGNRDGWYTAGGGSALAVSGGEMVGTGSTSQFLVSFAETSLAVGDSVEISFDMSLSSVQDGDRELRFGAYDSNGGSLVAADGFGFNNAIFEDYLGTRIYTNPGASGGALTRFAERILGSDSLLGGSYGAEFAFGSGVNLTSDVSYLVSILMSRTDATSLETSFALNGVVLAATKDPSSTFDLDTFALYSNANGNVTLDNFTVVSSIPEPSSAGIIMGVFAVCALFVRRRCVKQSAN